MSQSEFVHLHLHTAYSLLDGTCRIPQLVAQVKALGMKACAITDHNTLFGAIEFYDACIEAGIKPIIGCEVEIDCGEQVDHLVLLCQNILGYHNLIKIVSNSSRQMSGRRPLVSMQDIFCYSDGLIALSGCAQGRVPRLLRSGAYEAAKRAALEYAAIFPHGRFYLEIEDHGGNADKQIKYQMIRLAKETGIEPVAANDVHFIRPEDHALHQLVCEIADPGSETAHGESYYLKSPQEMEQLMIDCPMAIYNTARIAGLCNLRFEYGKRLLPSFSKPGEPDNTAYLRRLSKEGLFRRYPNGLPDGAKERLKYELSIIEQMGFVSYYLIVADFIQYARSKDIPVGPGRGSGAGSLVAYCIGITQVDPLRYGLLFERFLNPERVSMPDFDVDFCYERRSEVIAYIMKKYGADHVAQIVTFGTLAPRAAVRDVGRVLQIDPKLIGMVSGMLQNIGKKTLDEALKDNRPLEKLQQEHPQVKRLLDACRQIEGLPRHTATHAAGLVITPEPVDEYVPLANNDGVMVTQYTMTQLERLGLLKIDFLGLRTLTVLHDCETAVRKVNPHFALDRIPQDSAPVYQMLSAGETDGVFQLESAGVRRVLQRLQPTKFEDIIAVIALYRPGPMDAIPEYVRARHTAESVHYLHPMLIPILKETYGCIVYQEQVMQIFQQLAGYSFGQADIVRRAMSKKKAEVMEKEREGFLAGCAKNAISAEIAGQIFDKMAAFASYAFNKSHAASYAYLTYQTAYCRRFYPAEFYAAMMSAFCENTAKITGYASLCRQMGIAILPPDINAAGVDFAVETNPDGERGIRFALRAIRGVGMQLAAHIVENRKEHGDFTSFEDFCHRMAGVECNKNALGSLVMAGCFDRLCAGEHNRAELLAATEDILQYYQKVGQAEIRGQLSLFGEEEQLQRYSWNKLAPPALMVRLEQEKQVAGLWLSGHPLDEVPQESRPSTLTSVGELAVQVLTEESKQSVVTLGILQNLKVVRTKKGDQMAFGELADQAATLEVVFFASVYERLQSILVEGKPLFVLGRMRMQEGRKSDEPPQPQLVAQFGYSVSQMQQDTITRLDQMVSNGKIGFYAADESMEKVVYIRVSGKDDPKIAQLPQLFAKYPGEDVVYLYFEDQKQYFHWRQNQVKCGKRLANKLKEIFGEPYVVVKKRKKSETC